MGGEEAGGSRDEAAGGVAVVANAGEPVGTSPPAGGSAGVLGVAAPPPSAYGTARRCRNLVPGWSENAISSVASSPIRSGAGPRASTRASSGDASGGGSSGTW